MMMQSYNKYLTMQIKYLALVKIYGFIGEKKH